MLVAGLTLMAAPKGLPVSVSRPLGRSTAIFGCGAALSASMIATPSGRSGALRPVPYTCSGDGCVGGRQGGHGGHCSAAHRVNQECRVAPLGQ